MKEGLCGSTLNPIELALPWLRCECAREAAAGTPLSSGMAPRDRAGSRRERLDAVVCDSDTLSSPMMRSASFSFSCGEPRARFAFSVCCERHTARRESVSGEAGYVSTARACSGYTHVQAL
jgi:hypothetical protein